MLLILAATVAIHVGDLGRGFFADDFLFLDSVRTRSLLEVLMRPDPIGNFYRPLGRQFWFWSLGHATGESPFAFHAANLSVFLVAIALMWSLVRTAAGTMAAVIASAFLALHSAVDVPILWASGSQDLLALAGALGSLLAFQRGRPVVAAALFFLAVLAKETVIFTPLVAVLLVRAPNEPMRLRKALPFVAAISAWAVLQVLARSNHALTWAGAGFDPSFAPATVVSLGRAAFGLEASSRGFGATFALPWHVAIGIALAAAASALVQRDGPARRAGAIPSTETSGRSQRARILAGSTGLGWMIAGALPVVAVAPIWSSYYFLFALCGIGMMLGVLLAPAPRAAVVAAIVVLGLALQHARSLDEFAAAVSPWTSQSHVNRRYIERGTEVVGQLLTDLREQRPQLPPRSTLLFAGVPSFVAWQVADGPLVRWAYLDTSLRSYFLNDVTPERARRGPLFMFERDPATGRLRDVTNEPDRLLQNALGAAESEDLEVAELFYNLILDSRRVGEQEHYFGALVAAARGDRAAMRSRFAAAGLGSGEPAGPWLASASGNSQAGDTVAAVRDLEHAIRARPDDPEPHARIADLTLPTAELRNLGVVEAFAARALAPEVPWSWRRWAHAQAFSGRNIEALTSIERYFQMRPAAKTDDPGATALRSSLRERLPGGALSQAALREPGARQ